MITNVDESRLLVISDVHLGSPYFSGRWRTLDFFQYALENRYNVCINGDVIDIAQSPTRRLASDAPELFRVLKNMQKSGLKTYYVIGNHDIVLEYFLENWDIIQLAPFLNVASGEKRIRIEHGHLYDPVFYSIPAIYQWMTGFAGWLLNTAPWLYNFHLAYLKLRYGKNPAKETNFETEGESFLDAAREIADRGFDVVIFGHTHRAGIIPLTEDKDKTYFNPGGWVGKPCFLRIEDGDIELVQWNSN